MGYVNINGEDDYLYYGFEWWFMSVHSRMYELVPQYKKKITNKLMDYLYKSYIRELANGAQPLDFEKSTKTWKYKKWTPGSYKVLFRIRDRTKIPYIIVDSFFRSIWSLIRDGKLKYKILNPKQAIKDDKIKKEIIGKDVWDKINDMSTTASTITKLALVTGGVVGAGYLINKFK